MQKHNSDFNLALQLCNKDLSHDDLINFLKSGNVIERQYAGLTINEIKNTEEAEIILSNLTGVDGKIRETIALKLTELTKQYSELFLNNSDCYKIFANATIDIDGNVCRLAIESAKNLSASKTFSENYTQEMFNIINTALEEISKFTFRDKKYKINKQIFKIYWCLEALSYFYKYAEINLVINLLEKCANLSEYTIKEKCAKILVVIGRNSYTETLFNKLQNDENYYVRKIFE